MFNLKLKPMFLNFADILFIRLSINETLMTFKKSYCCYNYFSQERLTHGMNLMCVCVCVCQESVINPVTSSTSGSTQVAPTMTDEMITPTSPAMNATPPPPMMEDVSITLSNVSLFMDCSTSIEETCTIGTDAAQCTTGFGITYQRPGVNDDCDRINV